jgi:hypothetical protein
MSKIYHHLEAFDKDFNLAKGHYIMMVENNLALSILYDYFDGDIEKCRRYQKSFEEHINEKPSGCWVLTEEDIDEWMEGSKDER